MSESAFHLNVAAHSRSQGHSASAKIAYVAALRLIDPRTGRRCDYRRKRGVLRVGCANFAGTPAGLARMMDERETRQNSTVCREVIVALPHGLPLELRWRLLLAHAEAIAARWGVPVLAALHAPSAEGDQRNDHGHLVFATRRIENGTLTEKTRILDDRKTGSGEITWLRAASSRLIGETLDAVGRGQEKPRFDHRSYAARGIERPKTRHEGTRGRALARKSRPPRLCQDNRAIRAALAEKQTVENEIENERRRIEQDAEIVRQAAERAVGQERSTDADAATRGQQGKDQRPRRVGARTPGRGPFRLGAFSPSAGGPELTPNR